MSEPMGRSPGVHASGLFASRLLSAWLLLVGASTGGWAQVITTVAGGGVGDGAVASEASLSNPAGVFVDDPAALFIADAFDHRVRRVDLASGIISTVAGTGVSGFSGDGGPATEASLAAPRAVVVDGDGNLYIADERNQRIRRVDGATGIITTVAGTGDPGDCCAYSGDGGPATDARLTASGLALDGAGNLYIADSYSSRIRRVDAVTGIITTVVGSGEYAEDGFTGDGGLATEAPLAWPQGLSVDRAGHLYIADYWLGRILRVDRATGIVITIAGSGSHEFSGDGGPATEAGLPGPRAVAFDGDGNLYIACSVQGIPHGGIFDSRVRRVDAATGIITTVAGIGRAGASGDGAPATAASLSGPKGIALDASGNIYIADTYNGRVRRIDAVTGMITTIAGGTVVGDGGPAVDARLRSPSFALDALGNLYIADTYNDRVRRVDAVTGIITTVAGTGEDGFSGDGGPATEARLASPDIAVDASGHIYITGNNRIRRVDAATGIIRTIAGSGPTEIDFGRSNFSGDGGPATEARLSGPTGVFVDSDGHLYFADRFNHRIRRLDAITGIITTAAGSGEFVDDGSDELGDGGPAEQAGLAFPRAVFVDSAGHLYIADLLNNRVRRVDAATGIITTLAGSGVPFEGGFSGDGGPATEARLGEPADVYVDGTGHVYIADSGNHRIRRVDAVTGTISTLAGTGDRGFSGDGGPPSQAHLHYPEGVSVDEAGNLYIADSRNNRIRKVTVTPTAVTDGLETGQTATDFALHQNYPNPFNPATHIDYQLAQAGLVRLTIYSVLGQRMRVLVQGPQQAGFHQVSWDGTDAAGREVAAGVYVYRLAGPRGALSRRMVRMK